DASPSDVSVPLGQMPSKSPSDSDVRLEGQLPRPSGKGAHENQLTEEIDLDAELRKAEEAAKVKVKGGSRHSSPKLPTSSPFELSEADLDMPASQVHPSVESSTDFDLNGPQGQPAVRMGGSSAEIELPPVAASDEEVSLGEIPGASASGINLQDPADSGI